VNWTTVDGGGSATDGGATAGGAAAAGGVLLDAAGSFAPHPSVAEAIAIATTTSHDDRALLMTVILTPVDIGIVPPVI